MPFLWTERGMTATDAPRPKVLIVDDEAGLREMLVFGLTDRGYDVSVAADGDAGISMVETRPFDLVVSDIMMPGTSGVEVLKRIKEVQPTTEVIMATGFATLETAIESMKSGAYDFIPKPYELDQLCAVFGRALERRRLRAQVIKLQELNHMKYEFLANMIEDLRPPMTEIIEEATKILDRAQGDIVSRREEALKRITSSTRGLLRLTENIQHLSKLSTALNGMDQPDISRKE